MADWTTQSCDLSLSLQIAPEQVVLSHSPLRTLKSFHNKCVLVSGQGPVSDIANTYPELTSEVQNNHTKFVFIRLNQTMKQF